ncbi:UDP-N-acetyl-D-mannosamine dehydrogenase [Thermoplasmatales archaeon ex4572_165]|nr:MAG: UDP-N-acetyl-D-mannosamine dehydrogenase [Thermoplasmatales archaeon ex4572_165]
MGLPTALLLAKGGFRVKGYDIDTDKIQLLQNHILPFEEKGLETLFQEASKNFSVSEILEPSDVFIITVPTPLSDDKSCEMSYINSAIQKVKHVLRDGNLVVLESTVSPGTTTSIVKPILDETQKQYLLSYVSEKAIPGNTIYEMQHNHRIIGGIDQESAEKTKEIYAHFVESPIHLTDTTTAETVKLLENTYRDVNIALANEIAKRLAIQNIDAWEAIRLANFHPRVNLHQPGPGVGGHCIPIDPWFLSSDDTPLMKQSRIINDSMPRYVVGLAESLIKEKKNPIVVLLGVSYKGDVDDDRESPSYTIKKICEQKEMKVRLYDPNIKGNPEVLTDLSIATKDADCLILITDHSIFPDIDPLSITNMCQKNIVDTRDMIDSEKWSDAGFNVKVLGT